MGNFKLNQSGSEIQNILDRAQKLPYVSSEDSGKVLTVNENGNISASSGGSPIHMETATKESTDWETLSGSQSSYSWYTTVTLNTSLYSKNIRLYNVNNSLEYYTCGIILALVDTSRNLVTLYATSKPSNQITFGFEIYEVQGVGPTPVSIYPPILSLSEMSENTLQLANNPNNESELGVTYNVLYKDSYMSSYSQLYYKNGNQVVISGVTTGHQEPFSVNLSNCADIHPGEYYDITATTTYESTVSDPATPVSYQLVVTPGLQYCKKYNFVASNDSITVTLNDGYEYTYKDSVSQVMNITQIETYPINNQQFTISGEGEHSYYGTYNVISNYPYLSIEGPSPVKYNFNYDHSNDRYQITISTITYTLDRSGANPSLVYIDPETTIETTIDYNSNVRGFMINNTPYVYSVYSSGVFELEKNNTYSYYYPEYNYNYDTDIYTLGTSSDIIECMLQQGDALERQNTSYMIQEMMGNGTVDINGINYRVIYDGRNGGHIPYCCVLESDMENPSFMSWDNLSNSGAVSVSNGVLTIVSAELPYVEGSSVQNQYYNILIPDTVTQITSTLSPMHELNFKGEIQTSSSDIQNYLSNGTVLIAFDQCTDYRFGREIYPYYEGNE